MIDETLLGFFFRLLGYALLFFFACVRREGRSLWKGPLALTLLRFVLGAGLGVLIDFSLAQWGQALHGQRENLMFFARLALWLVLFAGVCRTRALRLAVLLFVAMAFHLAADAYLFPMPVRLQFLVV